MMGCLPEWSVSKAGVPEAVPIITGLTVVRGFDSHPHGFQANQLNLVACRRGSHILTILAKVICDDPGGQVANGLD